MTKPKKKELPMDVIEAACFFAASADTVRHILAMQGHQVSHDTLVRRIQEHTGLNYEQYRERIADYKRLSLMQKAFNMAEGGNVPLLIFCLKNICGWRDKPADDEDQYKKLSTVELIALVRQKLPELEGDPLRVTATPTTVEKGPGA